jgi:iron complex transport system permease protein
MTPSAAEVTVDTDTTAPTRHRGLPSWAIQAGLGAVLVAVFLMALGAGRLSVPVDHVAGIVADELARLVGLGGDDPAWSRSERTAVWLLRAPRAVLAVMVGAALAVAGAILQALFHNPLVSPDTIGVSSASSFGGVLVILLGLGGYALVFGAFAAGLVAVFLVLMLGRLRTGSPVLTIVLGGIVVAAFFNALVSLVTYLADPYTTLPAITFWLRGSATAATRTKVGLAAGPVAVGLVIVLALRWRINVLSLGDEESAALGVRPAPLRNLLIVVAALLTAVTVATAGVVGWVGLVIPHLVRLLTGPDHRVLIPASALVGGTYVLAVDTLARSVGPTEIPVGILTAVIGAPVFLYVLVNRMKGRSSLA